MARRTVADAVTNATATVTSASAAFAAGEVGSPVSGTNIPPGTFIGIRNSATSIGLSSSPTANVPVNATGSNGAGSLSIAERFDSGTGPNNLLDATNVVGAFGDTPQANDVGRAGYTVVGHQVANANPTSKEKVKASYTQNTGARSA